MYLWGFVSECQLSFEGLNLFIKKICNMASALASTSHLSSLATPEQTSIGIYSQDYGVVCGAY